MLRNIFLPDEIRTYYLFTQRIIGFEVGKTHVFATVIKTYGKKRVIEQLIEEPISADPASNYNEQVSAAIKAVLKKAGPYDSIFTALSSSVVVFKELTVPFVNLQKIKMIIPFEVESLLPFALQDAVIDAIVTKTDTATQQSEVIVAAVKNDYIQEHVQLFETAGVSPQKITVDMLELYGFFSSIPEYAQLQGAVAVIDLSHSATRIIIMLNGQLKIVRFLAKNFQSSNFLADIQFTLQTSLAKLPKSFNNFTTILLTGIGSETPDITESIHTLMQAPCEQLYAHKIIKNGTISTKNQIGIPSSFVISLATALSSSITDQFNLRQNYVSASEEKLLTQQLVTAAILMLLIITSYSLHSFFTVRSLSKEAENSEKEAIDTLKKVFTLKSGRTSLDQANKTARVELAKEEAIWFSLSTQNRFSFLTYLEELSSRIDRKGLGLDLRRVAIKTNEGTGEDILSLEGQVKDYNALRSLEEALNESKMFTNVPKLQETKFAITMILDKAQREE